MKMNNEKQIVVDISSCSFITGNLSALHCGIPIFNALCSVVYCSSRF